MQEKISPQFRERLDSLDEGESICALVTLTSPEVPIAIRPRREYRQQLVEEVEVYTTKTLDGLRSLIDNSGGQILGVSRPLSIITIQAQRSLIEKLANDDAVAAIIENQQIRSLDRI